MIDKEEIPLIIDQPEDNLDNQSVFRMLTSFIKKANWMNLYHIYLLFVMNSQN